MVSRRPLEERKDAVIEAAVALVRRQRLDWASTLTFGFLANATGVDQAQIARDFGSKEALLEAVIDANFGTDIYDQYIEDNRALADVIAHATDLSFPEVLDLISAHFDNLVAEDRDLILSHLAMLATAEEGSPEWNIRGRRVTALLETTAKLLDQAIDQLVGRGAVRRDQLNALEFITVSDALLEGMLIRKAIAPQLVPPGLMGRAFGALLAAAFGPDAETPTESLHRMPR